MKSKKGISLIVLVITIIVLLILVGVSISMLSGNDILGQAIRASEYYKLDEIKEKLTLNYSDYMSEVYSSGGSTEGFLEGYLNSCVKNGVILPGYISETGESDGSVFIEVDGYLFIVREEDGNLIIEPVGKAGNIGERSDITTEQDYVDNVLMTAPKIADGMIPIKYNSTTKSWEKVIDRSQEWYNYAAKQWANVVLEDATFNQDGTLDESAPYTQLVWIPRYAYKITSMYHQNGDATTAGEISVVFIDKKNRGKDGTKYKTTYPSVTAGSMSEYVVHPAFEYGDNEINKHIAGIWVGKFETSHRDCTEDITTGQKKYTGNEVITVRANVTSWRNLKIGQMFDACLNMNRNQNPYGLSTNDNVVDPHMLKNDEWGAIAYLSKSIYGKETEEVYINNNQNFITGIAGATIDASKSTDAINTYKTDEGVKASTSGNATGVYDMSGGVWEYTAAYVNNGNTALKNNGGNLTSVETAEKYRNVYASTVSNGSNAKSADYELTNPTETNGKYGDAVYETSNSFSNENGWYCNGSNFPSAGGMFFRRGGHYLDAGYAGVFWFHGNNGVASVNGSFRVGIVVL